VGQQHVVLNDLDLLEAVLAPAVADPFREKPVARRSGDVRLRSKQRMYGAGILGRWKPEKTRFPGALGDRGARAVTVDIGGDALRAVGSRDKDTKEKTEDTKENATYRQRHLTRARGHFTALRIARAASAPERPSRPVPG